MSDINVGVKTFTVRELDRSPGKVLAAADRDGIARVRRRNGRIYAVHPESTNKAKHDWAAFVERRRRRLAELFPNGPIMTPQQAREFDRMLADDARLL